MLHSHQGWHSKLESTQDNCGELTEELRAANLRFKDFVQRHDKKETENSETITFLQKDVSVQKQRLKDRHAVLMQRQDMLQQAMEGLRDSCHGAIDQMSTELSLCQGSVEFTKSRLEELDNPIQLALHDAQLENRSLVDELERRYPRNSFWSKSGKEFGGHHDATAVERGVSAPPGLPGAASVHAGGVGKRGKPRDGARGADGMYPELRGDHTVGTGVATDIITPFPPPSRGSLRTAPAGRKRGSQKRSGATASPGSGRTTKRKGASATRRRKKRGASTAAAVGTRGGGGGGGEGEGGQGSSDQPLGRWLADVGGSEIAL